MAIAMFSWGLSLTDISKLLDVTVATIHYWVKGFMDSNYLKPQKAELVTIPLKDLQKMLSEYNIDPSKQVVLVPIDDNTGDVVGMVGLPGKGSVYRDPVCEAVEGQEGSATL